MISKVKHLAAALAIVVPMTVVGAGCDTSGPSTRNERWATTENTNVKIDFDKVNEAYKLAEGPEDLEKRVNEIYEGDEVISIKVEDTEDKTQLVTGFFDKNTDGAVDDSEKIFTIKREITPEGSGQYQTTGYGHYGYYHSPFMGIATGMLMGSMMSSMFMPRYTMVSYATSGQRVGQLRQSRSSYRAANPSKFQRSKSGRTYNRPTTRPTSRPTRRFGGGRFGLARAGRTTRPERLTA